MRTHSQASRPIASTVMGMFLATVVSFASAQTTPAPSQPGSMGHSQMSGAGSDEMSRSMMNGMEQMRQMKPTGDLDKDFAMMMRMHHQQAVDMAKIEVQKGKSAEMKALATKIIKDQQKEIGQLDKFLQKHK